MKRIEFTTSRGTGYVEVPDDVISIRVPEGVCSNCNETDPLTYDAGINTAEDKPENSHKITIPGGEEDTEHLLPNIQ